MLFRTLNKLKMSQLLCGVMLRTLDLEKKSLYSSTFAWRYCLVGVGFCIYTQWSEVYAVLTDGKNI